VKWKSGFATNAVLKKRKHQTWTIEGPTHVSRHSVISQGHYENIQKPKETFTAVHGGRKPQLLMDIHSVSEVNDPSIDLSLINGPATSDVYNPSTKQA